MSSESIGHALCFAVLVTALVAGCKEAPRTYSGSASCRDCHASFYELWSTSHHGRALQPWSADLAAELPPQGEPIDIDGHSYQAVITPERGCIVEDGQREYEILYAMGGKNYYNFLTLLDQGRLQVLPVFYNVQKDAWENTTQSMLRHFEGGLHDTPLHWRDSMLTFNSACFSCHVSQLESNYDAQTRTYATTWNEAGISCESCHGPASEHIRVCRAAQGDRPPEDLELIRWCELTVQQGNDSCSVCHTKGGPLTAAFETGDRYWDHYDLTTFEHVDYYPSGHDLGENYTLGSWLLSPCVNRGNLSCTHCHTSSGRYRFHGERANHACLPCHAERVENAAEHIHHPEGGATGCVDCHMAMHSFGGMNQSDHSMRPPLPNLSIAVGARNACTLCHTDQTDAWALEQIRSWHPDFDRHTAPEMHRASLVKALREGDWGQLPAALDYVSDSKSDPLFATTLIRLLPSPGNSRQSAVLRERVVGASHPLVRAAAAGGLDADQNPADRQPLFDALSDEYRLVRVRAAERLAALPETEIDEKHRAALASATQEMWDAFNLRLDHWGSHFNIGNILMRQKRYEQAAARYDRAHELRGDIAPPLVNAAMALAALNQLDEAEVRLRKATTLPEPSAEAYFNLGLLLAEQDRAADAESALRKCLEIDPANHVAACNLAILLAGRDYPETFRLLRQAVEADPYNSRYVQTLAYYYIETGQFDQAKAVVEQALERGLTTPEVQVLYRQLQR